MGLEQSINTHAQIEVLKQELEVIVASIPGFESLERLEFMQELKINSILNRIEALQKLLVKTHQYAD